MSSFQEAIQELQLTLARLTVDEQRAKTERVVHEAETARLTLELVRHQFRQAMPTARAS